MFLHPFARQPLQWQKMWRASLCPPCFLVLLLAHHALSDANPKQESHSYSKQRSSSGSLETCKKVGTFLAIISITWKHGHGGSGSLLTHPHFQFYTYTLDNFSLSHTHTYTQYCLVNWLNINSVPPVLQRGCVEQYSVLQTGLLAVNSPESSNPSRSEGSDWHSPDSCQSDLYESNTQHSTFCVENI